MSSFVYILATGCVIAGVTVALMARSNNRHLSSFQSVQVVRKGMHDSDVYRVLGHANDIDGYGNGDQVLCYPSDIEVVMNEDGVVTETRQAGRQIDEIRNPLH